MGRHCYSVLDDADRPCERCPLERMFATGQTQKVERWLPSLGRYLEISATPLRDASGQIVAGLELIHDLTARRVTERALFESEQRFRNIFQESAEPVLLVSAVSGSIVDANEAATSLLGYKKTDLVRNGFTPLMTHSEVASLRERLLNPELKEGFAIERQKMYRQDGEILILTLNARLIRLRGENVYYCSLWDLTEKVRLDEYWRQSLEKLIQAEKMAFLGTMVSGFAHDINNPNQLVASNISLLSEVWPDAITALDHIYSKNPGVYLGGLPLAEVCEAVPRAIRDIRVGSDRISKIVSNLMSFARSEETTLKDTVHINDVVENATALLRHRIRKQTDHFRFTPGEGIPTFPGNRQRLEQVIINLISNALESLADPGAAVVVLTDYSQETEEIVVQVEDEGAGIPADILSRIQEPFFTTKQGRGGSGLGLTISRVFVQEHGGILSFESRAPSQGTRATIRLPVRKKAEVTSVTYL